MVHTGRRGKTQVPHNFLLFSFPLFEDRKDTFCTSEHINISSMQCLSISCQVTNLDYNMIINCVV